MARAHTEYLCRECGFRTPQLLGRCPECESWSTLERVVATAPAASRRAPGPTLLGVASAPVRLDQIDAQGLARLSVPMDELARVLGGGIVRGSLMLVGGDPGVGKSTLLSQVSNLVAREHGRVLYVSGEESLSQVGLRAQRMGLDAPGLLFSSETDIDTIAHTIESSGASLAVVDSIQSVMASSVESLPGSVSQLRECTLRLMQMAKSSGIPVFLVGHVTKEGAIAGPKVLEHMVDAVLYLEGERFHAYRLLRSTKNRFGPTHEVGVFEMHEEGLVEVPNPSSVFLEERGEAAPGSVVTVTLEGTRPILVEVQALASKSALAVPRRTANGFDTNRLHLITAVISRRLGLPLHDQDIYLNVVGGLRIDEPAADLAAALAIVSSLRDRPLARELLVLGEIGLSGELRGVGQTERRLKEGSKLGFAQAITPSMARGRMPSNVGMEVLSAATLREAARVAGL